MTTTMTAMIKADKAIATIILVIKSKIIEKIVTIAWNRCSNGDQPDSGCVGLVGGATPVAFNT